MTHLWQSHFGSPGRGRYHNDEWADKKEAIGLMPSSTGKPGMKILCGLCHTAFEDLALALAPAA